MASGFPLRINRPEAVALTRKQPGDGHRKARMRQVDL